MDFPRDLRYTKDHEWCRIDGGVAIIGITDFAQSELGDVVFLELPEVGSSTVFGEEFGTIEAVKAVAELFAPVSGEVVEVNTALEGAPETVNQDPYGEGWMVKVRFTDTAEPEALMDASAYESLVGEGH